MILPSLGQVLMFEIESRMTIFICMRKCMRACVCVCVCSISWFVHFHFVVDRSYNDHFWCCASRRPALLGIVIGDKFSAVRLTDIGVLCQRMHTNYGHYAGIAALVSPASDKFLLHKETRKKYTLIAKVVTFLYEFCESKFFSYSNYILITKFHTSNLKLKKIK